MLSITKMYTFLKMSLANFIEIFLENKTSFMTKKFRKMKDTLLLLLCYIQL